MLYLRQIPVKCRPPAVKSLMSIYIVFGIIALIILLAGYAFISHTLEKRRVRRQRLLGALRLRERNFKDMLVAFPPHFLPAELNLLVHRALIETCEQLVQLDPRNPGYQADATHYAAQLSNIKIGAERQRIRLENPTQIKELRRHLEELFRFVEQQEQRKLITPLQAATYREQVKRLALQAKVDAYLIQAKLARQQQKWRLAIHFLTLAQKALKGENTNHVYDKQIAQLNDSIGKLQDNLSARPEITKEADEVASETSTPLSKEWEHLEQDEWKKKQLYD